MPRPTLIITILFMIIASTLMVTPASAGKAYIVSGKCVDLSGVSGPGSQLRGEYRAGPEGGRISLPNPLCSESYMRLFTESYIINVSVKLKILSIGDDGCVCFRPGSEARTDSRGITGFRLLPNGSVSPEIYGGYKLDRPVGAWKKGESVLVGILLWRGPWGSGYRFLLYTPAGVLSGAIDDLQGAPLVIGMKNAKVYISSAKISYERYLRIERRIAPSETMKFWDYAWSTVDGRYAAFMSVIDGKSVYVVSDLEKEEFDILPRHHKMVSMGLHGFIGIERQSDEQERIYEYRSGAWGLVHEVSCPVPGETFHSMAMAYNDDERLAVFACTGVAGDDVYRRLVMYDLDGEEPLWSVRLPEGADPWVLPVGWWIYGRDLAVITAAYNREAYLMALTPGGVAWKRVMHVSAAAPIGGHRMLVLTSGQEVLMLDARTGETLWSTSIHGYRIAAVSRWFVVTGDTALLPVMYGSRDPGINGLLIVDLGERSARVYPLPPASYKWSIYDYLAGPVGRDGNISLVGIVSSPRSRTISEVVFMEYRPIAYAAVEIDMMRVMDKLLFKAEPVTPPGVEAHALLNGVETRGDNYAEVTRDNRVLVLELSTGDWRMRARIPLPWAVSYATERLELRSLEQSPSVVKPEEATTSESAMGVAMPMLVAGGAIAAVVLASAFKRVHLSPAIVKALAAVAVAMIALPALSLAGVSVPVVSGGRSIVMPGVPYTMAYHDGLLYVGTSKWVHGDKSVLVAVDPGSGRIEWNLSEEDPAPFSYPLTVIVEPSPEGVIGLAGNTIYIISSPGHYEKYRTPYRIVDAALATRDKIYFAAHASDEESGTIEGYLGAIDRGTGRILWTNKTALLLSSGEPIIAVLGDTLYKVDGKAVTAYRDGKTVASFRVPGDETVNAIQACKDRLYAATTRAIYQLDPETLRPLAGYKPGARQLACSESLGLLLAGREGELSALKIGRDGSLEPYHSFAVSGFREGLPDPITVSSDGRYAATVFTRGSLMSGDLSNAILIVDLKTMKAESKWSHYMMLTGTAWNSGKAYNVGVYLVIERK